MRIAPTEHPRHYESSETLAGRNRGEYPESVDVHQILMLPRAGFSLHISPRGILFRDPNMTEGPFCQRQVRQSREEDIHCEIFKISVEIICSYPLLKPYVPCVMIMVNGTWITSRQNPNASYKSLSC
jgi:hypothetical protein